MNPKRVQRIWRREGLKVPKKQPKRARLWLNDGSCIRLRPERRDHVWAYDFVHHCTHEGRPFRLLTIVDEYTRECLAIDVERRLNSESVLERLGELFVQRAIPEHIRSDNGPEFTATALVRRAPASAYTFALCAVASTPGTPGARKRPAFGARVRVPHAAVLGSEVSLRNLLENRQVELLFRPSSRAHE